jgi:hypothetical protein
VPLYSVFNVASGAAAEKMARDIGSYAIEKIPDSLVTNAEKKIEIEAHKTGKPHIDQTKISGFVGCLSYPLYFLDYETVMSAIPLYDGTRSFQAVPFQFSLHVQDAPGAALVHHSFLHKEMTDPRQGFVEALVKLCGDTGNVVVYNQNFESSRNNELAQAFPQHKNALVNINARMVDLYVPFQKRWLYHPTQNGSASIKKVLPAFTALSYDGLDIAQGEDAAQLYLDFAQGKMPKAEVEKLWPALEAYCGLDTRAMAELLAVLQHHATPVPPQTPPPCPV